MFTGNKTRRKGINRQVEDVTLYFSPLSLFF